MAGRVDFGIRSRFYDTVLLLILSGGGKVSRSCAALFVYLLVDVMGNKIVRHYLLETGGVQSRFGVKQYVPAILCWI